MSGRNELRRRDLLKAGTLAFSALARPGQVLGANDRVRVAIVGVRGRGMDHLQSYAKLPNVQIAALCDVDDSVMGKAQARIEKLGTAKPATFVDVRKVLEDAISIAAPNHWHVLMGIWACQAGKDAFVEKPGTHNLWEGKQLVAAAARYGRMVQHGTQSRSDPAIREAIEKVHGGLIGDAYMAHGTCFKWRDTIGRAPVESVPAGVDYDLWTGPAPQHGYTKNRFHYNWHWMWAYGNGDIGNQGVHQLDVARWGLGLGFPNKVSAIGGHFMFDDDQETPNDLNCSFQYDLPGGKRRMITFEVRHWMTNNEAEIGTPEMGTRGNRNHNTIGSMFYGSKGYMAVGDEDASTYKVWLGKEQTPQAPVHSGDDVAHYRNFIDCVISRKKENLNAPFEEGHISCAMMHLANASYRLGRTLNFNPDTQQVIGDEEAAKLLHDGDRGYRAPFVVPEKV
jgi:predicted dehydrogenase